MLSLQKKNEAATDFDNYQQSYMNLLYNYNLLIDGGNTPALLQEIQQTWPSEAWELREALISQSPYLSQEALIEAAESDILPHAMLLEVCIANPEATYGEEFLSYLQEGMPSPMPYYMIEIIRANWITETTRSAIEGTMASLTAKSDYASNLLISHAMLDSIKAIDDVKTILAQRNHLSDNYKLADIYISTDQYDSAYTVLDQISQEFELNSRQQELHQFYSDYLDFRYNLYNNDKTIAQLDSNEVNALHSFAESTYGRVSDKAYNILCFFYGICKENQYQLPKGMGEKKKGKLSDANKIIGEAYNDISIYPNPAGVYATINWKLPLLETNAVLSIKDFNGKTIIDKTISGKEGQWVWDTRDMAEGIYLYEVLDGDKQLKSGKIVVKH